MSQPLLVPPGQEIRLADFDARYHEVGAGKSKAADEIRENTAAISDLSYRMYAENKRALLLVLQGMDTSGKDGTIRNATRGINPQICQVTSFKQPSEEELDHHFLWRINRALPRRGNVGIFNRSHYEDVLVVRVHNLVPKATWKLRYDQINNFEASVVEGRTQIIKCFLHVSKDEQRERLQARLDNPNKRWKFSHKDIAERGHWNDYQQAYEAALSRCNTAEAPWHIVPADRKWYRNLVVSRVLREKLENMNPQFPPAEPGLEDVVVE